MSVNKGPGHDPKKCWRCVRNDEWATLGCLASELGYEYKTAANKLCNPDSEIYHIRKHQNGLYWRAQIKQHKALGFTGRCVEKEGHPAPCMLMLPKPV